MPENYQAVFLSYASQDADTVRILAEALRAAGIEVWFDQNELVGGDAWDAKIRRQIGTCALFVPVISAATQARLEGYFRLEWKIAAQRTHTMAEEKAFLLPVVIDDTSDAEAMVPAEFKAVQWTRLRPATRDFGGQAREEPAAFCARVRALLDAPAMLTARTENRAARPPASVSAALIRDRRGPSPFAQAKRVGLIVLATVALGCGILAYRTIARRPSQPIPAASTAPEKSVAVLPFASLSTEKDNEFFADALHDDVITHLQKIRDLKVISRTSVLAYRDNATRNLAHLADALGVATIVEGSVRRLGNKVRVNAKLIDARNETSLWAETLEGDAADAFVLQANLAQRIAGGLRATLTGSERQLITRRATVNPEAYELYQRGRLLQQELSQNARMPAYERVLAFYEQAVAKDPDFAIAHAQLAIVHGRIFWFEFLDSTPERRARAEAALATATRLAPNAPETHLAKGALAYLLHHDWRAALAEYALAEPGLPNDAQVHFESGLAHRRLGNWRKAVDRFKRAVELDPTVEVIEALTGTLITMRSYHEVIALSSRYLKLFPDSVTLRRMQAQANYALNGDRAAYIQARRISRSDSSGEDLGLNYELAMVAGDWAQAERVLTSPQLTTLRALDNHREPVAIRRAMLAFLRGDPAAAKRFAEEAISDYRNRPPAPRWFYAYQLGVAEAETYAGRGETAVRQIATTVANYTSVDAFSGAQHGEFVPARIYLILGRTDDAFASLRRMMSSPGPDPQIIRDDPFWARVKDDPRFEEILKSAKTF